MQLELAAAVPKLARLAVRHLGDRGHRILAVEPVAPPPRTLLRLPVGVPETEVAAVLAALMPLAVAVTIEPGRSVARLELAVPDWPGDKRVRVQGLQEHVDPLVAMLRAVGMKASGRVAPSDARPGLSHAGLPPEACGLLAWLGACHGQELKLDTDVSGGTTVFRLGEPVPPPRLEAPSPQTSLVLDAALPASRHPVQPILPQVAIHTDSPADAEPLRVALDSLGFSRIDILPLNEGLGQHRFLLTPPTELLPSRQPAWCRLLAAWLGVLESAGVPLALLPPLPSADAPRRSEAATTIHLALPMAAWRRGELHPVLVGPGRFHVEVRAREKALAEKACMALRQVGFAASPGRLPKRDQEQMTHSRLLADELLDDPASLEQLEQALSPLMAELAPAPVAEAEEEDGLSAFGLGAFGGAPGPAVAAGARAAFDPCRERSLGVANRLDLLSLEVVTDPARRIRNALQPFQLLVYIDEMPALKPLRDALATWAGRPVRARPSHGNPSAVIQFGGAPEALVQALAVELERVLGVPFELDHCWSPDDCDIWVHVPQPPRVELADEPDPFDDSWGRPVARAEDGSPLVQQTFLELHDTWLRVGPVRLPRRLGPTHPLAPPADLLDRMCLDAGTARLLVDLASAAQANEPCLLEGPTSATKTSGILLLASLLGQPVLRLNLSSQTDTSELVGQYVPDPTGGFRWQDGAAVRAAQEGWWLVIDEINLGPPQVVERLNSLLEQPPMLTLAERDHRVLGTVQQPIHPDFRLFATMNPAGYAGRSALSPAGKDRWLRQIQVPTPDEAAIEAMLRHAVWGEQPQVAGFGSTVHDPHHLATTPGCGAAPIAADALALDDFVMRLAKFHASVLTSGETQPLGASRQEPYVFTRRGLLALVQRVRREVADGTVLDDALRAGLRQSYVDRVAACDRPALGLLLDAVGLGPRTWQVGQVDLAAACRRMLAVVAGDAS